MFNQLSEARYTSIDIAPKTIDLLKTHTSVPKRENEWGKHRLSPTKEIHHYFSDADGCHNKSFNS